MPTDIRDTEYTFDNGSPEAVPQLRALESFLDPITAARIAPPLLAPGGVCWEIGAGGGSVARAMARAVGPAGRVLATDIDTGHLAPAANLEVRRHDVRTDPPPGDAFDLIHARLVLLHLPERRRVLGALAAALAPGGWLVVEEFDCTAPLRVLTAPNDDAAKLFTQVTDAMLGILQSHGADLAWAQDVHAELAAAGLVEVDTVTHSQSWAGGSVGASLYGTNSRQLEPELLDAGLSPGQLEAFRKLLRDPGFAVMSYQFVSTRGRRPVGG
ncbi:methyltransferase domain-containing protein [Micromonospora sp. C28SCA-DRY-2]|uniref:class I SAM-dependent methyltransferase n=1 Tax=Micromonospora sp. C28SCA-DRY-2 TaxID=3059522 RepID=UPI002676DF3D|nr:methyltransferase domain-containing protein [Micromonospora sp. C28SCA-DRY-2]MDO3704495.1 methyltransferase domain-containing protein [Micromonospora sp. C28SCA-DRY-2]